MCLQVELYRPKKIPRLLVLWVPSDIPKLFLFAPCTEQLFTPYISIYKPKISNVSTTFEDMRPNATFFQLNFILNPRSFAAVYVFVTELVQSG